MPNVYAIFSPNITVTAMCGTKAEGSSGKADGDDHDCRHRYIVIAEKRGAIRILKLHHGTSSPLSSDGGRAKTIRNFKPYPQALHRHGKRNGGGAENKSHF